MDLMLRVADRVELHEVPEAFEALQVRLGHASTQLVRSRVISDIRWHGGIRNVQDYTFFIEDFLPCSISCRVFPCRGLPDWLKLGEQRDDYVLEIFSFIFTDPFLCLLCRTRAKVDFFWKEPRCHP